MLGPVMLSDALEEPRQGLPVMRCKLQIRHLQASEEGRRPP